jgi:hypothetical protein
MRATDLSVTSAWVATLTGREALALTEPELAALRAYVSDGGVLMVDAAGSSAAFAESVRTVLLPALGARGVPLDPGHPLASGAMGEGYAAFATELGRPIPNGYAAESGVIRPAPPTLAAVGKGYVIVSDLDVTTGLLESGVWGYGGYSGRWARGLASNVMLWVMAGTPGPTTAVGK